MIRSWLTALDPEMVWHPESNREAARLNAEDTARICQVKLPVRSEDIVPLAPQLRRLPEIRSQDLPAICLYRFAMGS